MRILHISDLHFGTEIPDLVADFFTHLRASPADIAIASGDFTQTGSTREFITAAAFLKELGIPVICVPGNHDVPRADLAERFSDPFGRYRTHIGTDTEPAFMAGNACIAGINTARAALPHWNWANGAISRQQIRKLQDTFGAHPGAVRICVMHHPVHKAEGNPMKTVVFGGARALRDLTAMKADLVLTGHVHHASITTAEADGHKTVFLSASTTLSRRVREGGNGYNLITVRDDRSVLIEIFSYAERSFAPQASFEFQAGGR